MERKYVAFISYRHAELDSAVAKQVHTLVEQYVIPRSMRKGEKKLGIVFRDQEELPISSNLSDDICRALDNSKYLIVICSKNTAQSPWVGREISYFLSHHPHENAFAVLASGEPVDVFPQALTQRREPDGSLTEVEPLAVDVRADSISAMKKKLKREITRLYAALIGCPYDALVMREQRRKRRQLSAIMAVILAVVTSFAAVTLVKNHQIDQKNEELAGMNLTLEDKNLELAGKNQELEEKNFELDQQKKAVQLRESELLTEKGMTALAEGDTQTAVANFLAALPSTEEDRPYYALAEQGLIGALEVYNSNRTEYKIFETVLEQKTPIKAYAVSHDTSKVITLDTYGLTTCYAAADGSVLWTAQAGTGSYVTNGEILSCGENNTALVFFGETLTALDCESGTVVWQKEWDDGTRMYLSPDETALALLIIDYNGIDGGYTYRYSFLSAQTGEVLQTIELGSGDYLSNVENDMPYWYFSESYDLECPNGVFSSDGNLFATNYQERTDDDQRILHYILLDRTAGTCRDLCSIKLTDEEYYDNSWQMCFTDSDTALLGIRETLTGSIAARIDKIDVATGKRLWTAATPEEEAFAFLSSDKVRTVQRGSTLYLCRGNRIYTMDPATGKVEFSRQLDSRAMAFEKMGDHFVSIVLEDGLCSLVWVNENGIHLTEDLIINNCSVGSLTDVKQVSEGLFRVSVEDGYITYMGVGTREEGCGYVCGIPEGYDNRLVIKKAVAFEEILHPEKTEILDADQLLVDGDMVSVGTRMLVLGRFSQTVEGQTAYTYRMVDLDTHAVVKTVQPEGSYTSPEYFAFLPDGSGYISTADFGSLKFHDLQTGTVTTLCERESLEIGTVEETQTTYIYEKYIYSSAVQSADGRLLTAAMSKDALSWWFDGVEGGTTVIPEDLCVENLTSGTICRRLLVAGENGCIVVGNFTDQADEYIDSLAAYHIATDTWYRFGENLHITADCLMDVDETALRLTLCDTENLVTVYDFVSGQAVHAFHLQLPGNAVRQILAKDDRFIAVLTTDGGIYLHDTASGEVLYSRAAEGYSSGKLCMQEDTVNGRLYIWEDGTLNDEGCCIDTESWTELAQITGLAYYDPETNEAYLYGYALEDQSYIISVCHIPTLEELIAAGQSLLAE